MLGSDPFGGQTPSDPVRPRQAPSSRRSNIGGLGLNLITGPANAGKVALLLRRYLEVLPDEPYLIVPNRSDVEERERELLALQPALVGGWIGTFDALFWRLACSGRESCRVAGGASRSLIDWARL